MSALTKMAAMNALAKVYPVNLIINKLSFVGNFFHNHYVRTHP